MPIIYRPCTLFSANMLNDEENVKAADAVKGRKMVEKDVEQIQCLLENALGIMLIFRQDGLVIFLNETGKKELGYESGECTLTQILPGFAEEGTKLEELIAEKNGVELRLPVYRSNMTCFPGRVRYAVGKKEGDQIVYLASIVNLQKREEEVNELAKIETQAKENMRARNEFVANITHELRTPVNGIKGHIENLKAEETDAEKRRTMDIVLDCCTNMQKIINNLLDFSKIEAGKFVINEELFDVRECINHALDTSMMVANEKGIKLSSYVSEDVPKELIGDPLRITQILNNLISNAMKFTMAGYVRVEVYNTMIMGDEIELTIFVIDTGIGVTLEEKERMFKSFSQVDGTITRQYGGTGLGLYVSRQLVELMHGQIELESEKGKGSTFQFYIKLKRPEGESALLKEREKEDEAKERSEIVQQLKDNMKRYQEEFGIEEAFKFQSAENVREVRTNLEKLSLCIEMNNWAKAEQFAETIKKLCEQAPKEVKGQIFKMLMAIRREDYEKSTSLQKEFERMLTEQK